MGFKDKLYNSHTTFWYPNQDNACTHDHPDIKSSYQRFHMSVQMESYKSINPTQIYAVWTFNQTFQTYT